MATTPAPQYPFDQTGTAATNLIKNELKTLAPPAANGNWSDFYFIVPAAAPFYAEGVQITLMPSGRLLSYGVDYIFSHRFYDATKQLGKPVYGSITFIDKTLSGYVSMNYQTLGGIWTLDSAQIATILANTLLDPRTTTWEEVVNLPQQFPPISHQWGITDMVGASALVESIDNIVTALQSTGDQGLAQHEADFNNPHRVTAAQVGLGSVSNFPIATTAQAQQGSSNAAYLTPASALAEINQFAVDPLNAHIADTDNPHHTTAAQVGLDLVNNAGWASTSDAQQGTVTTGYMNPATTAAAITAQVGNSLAAHIANTDNPHQTTATQVGLGDVPNYPMATEEEALAGTASDRFMSPALVTSVINQNFGGDLAAHIADHNNPHQTTAAQVGSYTTADADAALAAGLATKLDTTAQAADSALLQGKSVQDILSLVPTPATAATIQYSYPAYTPDDSTDLTQSWTQFARYLPVSPADPDNPVEPIVLLFVGGESRGTAGDIPQAKLVLDIRDAEDPIIQVIQAAGTSFTEDNFTVTADPDDGTLGFWYISTPSRNAITTTVLNGSGGVFDPSQMTNPVTDEPANIIDFEVSVVLDDVTFRSAQPGSSELRFQQGFAQVSMKSTRANQPTSLEVFAPPCQYLNVAETADDATAAAALETSYLDAFHDFDRVASFNLEPAHAASLTGWSWDNVDAQFVSPTITDTLLTLLSPEAIPVEAGYGLEVEFSSTNAADQAIGVCLGYVIKDGRRLGLWAMRTPGGTVIDSQNGNLPGGDYFKLFTIGLNLFQADAKVVAATGDGLTWGDGVADADRASTPYVPQSQTAGTNGWASKGSVRIRASLNGTTLTVETTDFGSATYVAAAKQTIDISSLGDFSSFHSYGGLKWGLAMRSQPTSRFSIIQAPDMYLRYAERSSDPGTGSDTSTLNFYCGDTSQGSAGWLSFPLSGLSGLIPGRLVYSDYNTALYSVRRDGTLKPLNISAFNPSGRSILTT